MNLLELDFAAQTPEKKAQIVNHIVQVLDETAEQFTFFQKILAQTLFLTRSYCVFQQLYKMLSLPVPALFQDLMEAVWDYILGKRTAEDLEGFCRGAESVLICLMAGDDEDLDEAAWNQYQAEWDNPLYFNLCLEETNASSYLLGQIVSGKITWYELTDGELMASITCFIREYDLEVVFKKDSGSYTPSESDRQCQEIYSSTTFVRAFAMLQEDLRTAQTCTQPAQEALLALRAQAQNKTIFTPEQIKTISKRIQRTYSAILEKLEETKA